MTGLIAFLVLIGILIAVHEFGHFIVAKAFGVKVEAFSLGFGQPLVKFQYGETEYKICWIPLGGYVRMLGQGDYELDEEKPKEVTEADKGRSINEQTPWVRILIYAAGPAMNLLLPFFIITPFIALSSTYKDVPDNTIGAVDASMPAGKAGLVAGDTIIAINGEPVETFWQVRKLIGNYEPASNGLKLTIKRSADQKVTTHDVVPKPIRSTHPFLGYEKIRYQIGYQPAALDTSIGFLTKSHPLVKSGLQTGDQITKVNGQAVQSLHEILDILRRYEAGEQISIDWNRIESAIDPRFPFLKERRQHQRALSFDMPGTQLVQNVVHSSVCVQSIRADAPVASHLAVGDCIMAVDGERHTLGGYIERALATYPEKAKQMTIMRNGEELVIPFSSEAYEINDPMAGTVQLWSKGFTLPRQRLLPPKKVRSPHRWSHGWFEATSRVPREIEDTIRSIAGIFSGGVSPAQLSGPLTMYHLADSSVRAGLESYLNLMVLLSLSIGLFNLLPIPLLDGGQILLASVEWVARRPLPVQVQTGLQYLGLVMILMLLMVALGNDAMRTWRLTNG